MIEPLIEEEADRGKIRMFNIITDNISMCFSVFAFPSLWFTQEAAHLGWLTRLLKLVELSCFGAFVASTELVVLSATLVHRSSPAWWLNHF